MTICFGITPKRNSTASNSLGGDLNSKEQLRDNLGTGLWAVWMHRSSEITSSGNTLYFLRLVIENQDVASTFSSENKNYLLQAEQLKMIHQAAQAQVEFQCCGIPRLWLKYWLNEPKSNIAVLMHK